MKTEKLLRDILRCFDAGVDIQPNSAYHREIKNLIAEIDANPPMVEGFPEAEFRDLVAKLPPIVKEHCEVVARWGFGKGCMSHPQPAPDERKGPFEKFAEFVTEGDEPTSSPEALKRLDDTIQTQLERAQATTGPTRQQVAELVEAAREVVKWIHYSPYRSALEKALAPFAEKGGS